jgi:hypothetical protein
MLMTGDDDDDDGGVVGDTAAATMIPLPMTVRMTVD